MWPTIFPDFYTEDVFSIPFQTLYHKGFRALIFDIDNTLVPHGADSTPEIDQFFIMLHDMGFKTLLLSNNNEQRIDRFNKNINTLFIANAGKPSSDAFLKALRMLKVAPSETIMIGDTTFTDIRGSNRAGIANILVKYIGYYNKNEKKGIKRTLERFFLSFYPFLLPFRKRLKFIKP